MTPLEIMVVAGLLPWAVIFAAALVYSLRGKGASRAAD